MFQVLAKIPRKQPLTMQRFRFSATVMLSMALGAGPLWADQSVTLLITADNERLYPVLASPPPEDAPDVALEEELARQRSLHPMAYMVEAGNYLSLTQSFETHYGYLPNRKFRSLEYDAVLLSARDGYIGLVSTVGYNADIDPLSERERTVSNLRAPHYVKDPTVATLRLSGEGRPSVELISLADPSQISAATGISGVMVKREAALMGLRATEAVAEGALVVAVADPVEGLVEENLGRETPAVIVRRGGEGDGVRTIRGRWEVRAPRGGEILRLAIPVERPGNPGQPTAEFIPVISTTEWDNLVGRPIPEIGFPIPQASQVFQTFFPRADAERIQEDRLALQDEAFQSLTTRSNVTVYHVVEDEPLRVYRLVNRMKDPRFGPAGIVAAGWPEVNMLVAMTHDHRIHQVISRQPLPIGGQPTALVQAANQLAGLDPVEWKVDEELTRGLEDVWEWLREDLLRVVELDTLLFAKSLPAD
jgi:hypothetical protein